MVQSVHAKSTFETRRTAGAIRTLCLISLIGCGNETAPAAGPGAATKAPPSSLKIEIDYRVREGDEQLTRSDFANAIESYRRVIRLEPGNIHARIQLCRAQYKTGAPKMASITCKRALTFAPNNLEVLHRVLQVLVEAGQPHEAFEPLQQALLKAPSDPRFLGLQATLEKSGTGSSRSRKDIWTSEPFRCRAVSTARLRTCRFKKTDNGYRLTFAKMGVSCSEVEFDGNGDPSVLKGCRSNSIRIPSTAKLKADADRQMWSGSKSGWFWRDGDKYCCPGMWIAPPKALRK